MTIIPRDFIYFSTKNLQDMIKWKAVDLYLLSSHRCKDSLSINKIIDELELLEFEIYRRTKGESYIEKLNKIKKRIKNEVIDKYQDSFTVSIANKIIQIINEE